ncbi:MAG: hypothetical protein J0I34_07380 [Pseudonocardia sp.]|uniref:hypothetical protein n=1 Tax=Actinomycetes TaxID=1760 RepID=UPI00086A854C|nr:MULTISPECIES: hypothetical protein [Actinomycetes]MBN9108589.1 hypothetical protein [Pseudonocardia sp.]ODU27468.1 MAG: hypothetical protein ABS80_03565 [Pseudonocardia sp. SCN 72-51]ODV07770.1 MAG: hypothetical protein ABT15_06755 [Pseudonocardia sp. SCN 73-27]
MSYEPLPPPMPFDEAENLGITVLGTCDWGGCDREAWGVRWSRDLDAYLTVCASCRRGPGAVRGAR